MARGILPGASSDDSVSLLALVRSLEARIAALETQPVGIEVQRADFAPKAGQIVTVEAPPAGISVLLPNPRAQTRNARISISSRNANPIRWQAVDGTVNGVDMATSNAVGLVEAVCDGASWHVSQGAASPTGSVASTSSATYFLETADTGLPNARVAADSSSIDVDLTVAGAVSWKPIAGFFTWAYVLGEGAHSGAHTPIIDASQALNFASGATGITADGDLTAACVGAFTLTATDAHLHPTGALHVGHEGTTSTIHQGCTGAWDASCDTLSIQAGTSAAISGGSSVTLSAAAAQKFNADTSLTNVSGLQCRTTATQTGTSAAITWVTGGVARLTVLGNGEWSNPAGSANQYWKWQSGAFPIWSSLALSDLPSQSADTFLGRLAGAGTPTAQNLSDIDSTSIIYDTTSHTLQRAAFTSEVTAAQNVNALTVTRSTDYQASPWTGNHQFNAELRLGTLHTEASVSGAFNVTLTAGATRLLITSTADATLGTISGAADGRVLVLEHTRASGTGFLTLTHGTGANATACPEGRDLVLGDQCSITLVSNGTNWVVNETLTSDAVVSLVPGASINDLTRTNDARVVLIDPSAAISVTGAQAGRPGDIMMIRKVGTDFSVDLPNESTSSTLVKRWRIPQAATIRMATVRDTVLAMYDDQRWCIVSPRPPFCNTTANAADDTLVHDGTDWGVKAGGNQGRLLRVTQYTSGSGATHTWLSTAKIAIIDVLSSGGGGASVAAPAAGQATVGGGGGSGVWVRALWGISTTTLTYTVGAAASGNSSGNLSSVTDGTSTISCPGGSVGSALASGTSATFIGGGSSVSAPTLTGAGSAFTVLNGAASTMHPGDGGAGERVSGTAGKSGDGSPSPMGGGFASGRITTGNGITGKAPGAGGSGALSLNGGGAATGGGSLAGLITIYEFT